MARDFEGDRLLLPFRDKEKIKGALQKSYRNQFKKKRCPAKRLRQQCAFAFKRNIFF
jgi:hypothetical protein